MICEPSSDLDKRQKTQNENMKFKLHKLPVHLMTLLMWIPPACALKNRRWLNIILSYHVVVNIIWLILNGIFWYAVVQSNLFTIFPKVYLLLIATYNVLQTCHTWHLLYRTFCHHDQFRLCDKPENTTPPSLPLNKGCCVQANMQMGTNVCGWQLPLVSGRRLCPTYSAANARVFHKDAKSEPSCLNLWRHIFENFFGCECFCGSDKKSLTKMKIIQSEEKQNKPGHRRQFRVQKLTIYCLNISLWIPPQCALQNKTSLWIILDFHIVLLIFWMARNVFFLSAYIESPLVHIVPAIHTICFMTSNILFLVHECIFLHISLHHYKQMQILDALDDKVVCTWPGKHSISLALFLTCACGNILLTAFVETKHWSGKHIFVLFNFLEKPVVRGYSIVCVFFRVYQMTIYFLYTPYFACLCLEIQTKLEYCCQIISSHSNFETEKFTIQLHEALKLLSLVNSKYERNSGFFLVVSTLALMIWLYSAIVFRQYCSYWTFLEVGCFSLTLGRFPGSQQQFTQK